MTIAPELEQRVSNAALARARAALSKVSYTTEKIEDIVQAALHLPSVTVMAGANTNCNEYRRNDEID